MKKKLLLLGLIGTMLLTASPTTALSEEAAPSIENPEPVTIEEILSFYENTVNDPAWRQLSSRAKMGEALQIPEEMLSNMDTVVLAQAVLHYPYFMDVYAFDDIQSGVEVMYDTFNGMRELTIRSDAAETLLEIYENTPVDGTIFGLTNIEVLLAQPFVIEALPEDKLSQLLEHTLIKYKEKAASPVYGGFSETMFYRVAGSVLDDPDLLAKILAASPIE
ncbi:MAG: hypothetical protein HFE45_01630 [Oscillospiraceae bacterium]|jgi:hypothetical protein|nr:hypothetical protein [Oscillospiraceae bacterium]